MIDNNRQSNSTFVQTTHVTQCKRQLRGDNSSLEVEARTMNNAAIRERGYTETAVQTTRARQSRHDARFLPVPK